MKQSISTFAKNFSTLESDQLKKIIGGNGLYQTMATEKKKRGKF